MKLMIQANMIEIRGKMQTARRKTFLQSMDINNNYMTEGAIFS